MTHPEGQLQCPHCAARLRPLRLPLDAAWGDRPQWVCFNDDCSYFRSGWDWIWQEYRAKASYRYRLVDPGTGVTSPLPVWSEEAMRDHIDEEAEGDAP